MDIAEAGRHLGQRGKPRAVHAIIVREKQTHAICHSFSEVQGNKRTIPRFPVVTMRIALVHNRSAGSARYEARDLLALLRLAGHDARAATVEPRSLGAAIRARPDVMIAAGGDGTVTTVAIALHKSGAGIPLMILPQGTSNNIACSLDIPDDVPGWLASLHEARASPFDIGVVRAEREAKHFVEGAGFGVIGMMLARASTVGGRTVNHAIRLHSHVVRAALRRPLREHGVARLIRRIPPCFSRVVADGEDLSGDYIAVEALNIRQLGPQIVLAPQARTDDGMLDLLLVPPSDRGELADFVDAGSVGTPPGIRRLVRRLDVTWPRAGGHVDDASWPPSDRGHHDMAARIEIAGAIQVLRPWGAPPLLDAEGK